MSQTLKKAYRDQQRELVQRLAKKRAVLRKRSKDPKLSLEERMEARAQLGQLPRNSSETRIKNRCKITGRPRGYLRRLGISRNMVRELAHQGVLPGLTKSSW